MLLKVLERMFFLSAIESLGQQLKTWKSLVFENTMSAQTHGLAIEGSCASLSCADGDAIAQALQTPSSPESAALPSFREIPEMPNVYTDETEETAPGKSDKYTLVGQDTGSNTTESIDEFSEDIGDNDGVPQYFPDLYVSKVTTQRSVVFLHHSYYHFYYLAQALRRRGWDAIVVSLADPETPFYKYFHGEDLNLYSPDPQDFGKNIETFFEKAKKRFKLMHFAGDGYMSFFPQYWAMPDPPDIIEWRNHGNKVAYTVSGCNSGISQTAYGDWTAKGKARKTCDSCAWQQNAAICSDEKNLAWGWEIAKYCDIIFGEAMPALDAMALPKAIREPTSMCLDPLFWQPDLDIPEELRIEKAEGEVLVYHAVGNYKARSQDGRDIKGTGAIFNAIDRLKAEGFPVRLIFVTDMKNTEVRYVQVQADIIVDQLHAGRYGATSREAMMLGKPTICHINPYEPHPKYQLSCMKELPLVSATEETIYEVLRDLILDPEKRNRLGVESRQYALKWHSSDACAERYEYVYDNLMKGIVGPYPTSWSYYEYTKHHIAYRPLAAVG